MRRRTSGVLKAIAIVAVVALVTAGGFAVNRLLVSEVNGAPSASDSVEEFISALEREDWTALGLLLPPDETYQLAGLVQDTDDLQRTLGSTGDSPGDQLEGISVDVSDLQLSTDSVATDLSKVSIDRATIVVEIDAKTIESFAEIVPDVDAADIGAVTLEFAISGPEVTVTTTTADDVDTETETVSVGDREQAPFLMSVRRDGGWFVSPAFTVAQYAAEELGWETAESSASEVTYDSPEQALGGFVDGLVTTLETADVNHVADAMGGVEARLLKTYAPGINAELAGEADLDFGSDSTITVDDLDVDVSRGENGQARVRIGGFKASFEVDGIPATVTFDGDCVRVVGDGESDGGCISEGGEFAERLYRALGHVVAVPADGGWKISPVATYFDWLGIAQQTLANVDADILKAVVGMDFSGVASGEPVASLGSDDEVTVEVDPVNAAIYAGVAVIDPEPSSSLVDFSCTAENQPGFCEVIVVDGNGDRQDRESDYSGDYGSEYGYDIADDTRLIVVAVAGPVVVESAQW